jgi:hypothetical protein
MTFLMLAVSTGVAAIPTAAELWAQYAANPDRHPNLPNCSYAGYECGEKPLPTPKVVANVRNAGAKGDGVSDDTDAFGRAIIQAHEAGGGAVLVPAGTYRIEGMVRLKHSRVVLRGEGVGKTVLDFPNSLSAVQGKRIKDGKSMWSWSGGLVWIGPADTFAASGRLPESDEGTGQPAWELWRPGKPLASLSAPAAAGDSSVTVDAAGSLKPGDLVLMTWDNPADHSLLKHIAGHAAMDGYAWATATWITPPAQPQFQWPVQIAAVKGNRVTLRQPLRLDARKEWLVRFTAIGNMISGSGIEELTIRNHAPASHKHLTNEGHNGVYINRAFNCFVRNVEIQSTENGVNVAASKNVTVSNVRFTGPEQHHHTLACRVGSHDVLFEDFVVDGPGRVKHGINTEWMSSGNVWRRGTLPKGTFDSHRGLSFDSIRTAITLANDADGAGGAEQAGPFLGKRMVHWNIEIAQSPRKVAGEFVVQPEAHPMGALVGIRGAAVVNAPAAAMPRGDKGCITTGIGDTPAIKDLYEAQLKLRLKK